MICFFCKKKGLYYGNDSKSSKKKDDKNEEKNKDDKNLKEKLKKNELTKCSTANCNKFYHLKCIDSNKLFKFIDSNNKRFRCSLHYCVKCNISGDSMPIA